MEIWSIVIPSAVTVAGWFVSYRINRNLFKRELEKMQKDKFLSKNENLATDLSDLLAKVTTNDHIDKKTTEQIREIFNRIYCYGSNTVVALLSDMQNKNYTKYFQGERKYELLAYYTVLLTQIKYDLIGVKTNPLQWLKLNITDYDKLEKQFKQSIGKIIEEYNLDFKTDE